MRIRRGKQRVDVAKINRQTIHPVMGCQVQELQLLHPAGLDRGCPLFDDHASRAPACKQPYLLRTF